MSTIGIAKLFTSVVTIAGVSASSPFLHQWRLDSLTRKSGSGRASEASIRISNGGGQSLSLSNTDIFFSGERVTKTLKLEDVKMTLGGYELKNGDILCSPKQNGNYFVIKGSERNRRDYGVVGHPNIRVSKCEEKNGITNTFKLEWHNRNLSKMSVSSISLETCNFVFEPQTTSNGWKIILRDCNTRWDRYGLRLNDLVLGQANYVLR